MIASVLTSESRAVSVPITLDVPGPFESPLSEQEIAVALTRVSSTPLPGDERLRILEMYIMVHEFNGNAHELGWFRPEETLGEVKRQTSRELCVPMDVLRLVSDPTISTSTKMLSASLDSDTSSLGDVWSPLTPGVKLNAIVQMPPEYEEILERHDDIRVHENAYDQLATLACEFETVTSANVNLSKRIVKIIQNALGNTNHNLSRSWAVEALKKLLRHLIRQFRNFDCKAAKPCDKDICMENLKSAVQSIGVVFGEMRSSGFWLERQAAEEGLAEIGAAGLEEVVGTTGLENIVCGVGARAFVGGA